MLRFAKVIHLKLPTKMSSSSSGPWLGIHYHIRTILVTQSLLVLQAFPCSPCLPGPIQSTLHGMESHFACSDSQARARARARAWVRPGPGQRRTEDRDERASTHDDD
jgi:hypothetical protein